MKDGETVPDGHRPTGLRERKKAKTRASIREHAMRLFREQGYSETTVDQIAAAAEVSPSTFFRYFPTKEDVVFRDDYEQPMIDALKRQPPDLSPATAVRNALRVVFTSLSAESWETERERYRLIRSERELRSALVDDFVRSFRLISTVIGERTGRDETDLELRSFCGALIGSLLGAELSWAENPDADLWALMDQALAHFEAGLPL